ncbi:hypothetical protein Kpol_1032p50, partial [Vanderwaltozyma polyspora DSM 70294]
SSIITTQKKLSSIPSRLHGSKSTPDYETNESMNRRQLNSQVNVDSLNGGVSNGSGMLSEDFQRWSNDENSDSMVGVTNKGPEENDASVAFSKIVSRNRTNTISSQSSLASTMTNTSTYQMSNFPGTGTNLGVSRYSPGKTKSPSRPRSRTFTNSSINRLSRDLSNIQNTLNFIGNEMHSETYLDNRNNSIGGMERQHRRMQPSISEVHGGMDIVKMMNEVVDSGGIIFGGEDEEEEEFDVNNVEMDERMRKMNEELRQNEYEIIENFMSNTNTNTHNDNHNHNHSHSQNHNHNYEYDYNDNDNDNHNHNHNHNANPNHYHTHNRINNNDIDDETQQSAAYGFEFFDET